MTRIRNRGPSCLVAVAWAISLACGASHSQPVTSLTSRNAAGSGRTRQAITAAELRQASGSNALQIIQQLRPEFLRGRGSRHPIRAFVDHTPIGGIEELRSLPAAVIVTILHLDAHAATQQFGSGHSAGAIHVITARGPR